MWRLALPTSSSLWWITVGVLPASIGFSTIVILAMSTHLVWTGGLSVTMMVGAQLALIFITRFILMGYLTIPVKHPIYLYKAHGIEESMGFTMTPALHTNRIDMSWVFDLMVASIIVLIHAHWLLRFVWSGQFTVEALAWTSTIPVVSYTAYHMVMWRLTRSPHPEQRR